MQQDLSKPCQVVGDGVVSRAWSNGDTTRWSLVLTDLCLESRRFGFAENRDFQNFRGLQLRRGERKWFAFDVAWRTLSKLLDVGRIPAPLVQTLC